MADPQHAEFDDLLREHRTFPPRPDFRANAHAGDEAIYTEAARDPEAFWARFASELDWSRPWDRGSQLEARAATDFIEREGEVDVVESVCTPESADEGLSP